MSRYLGRTKNDSDYGLGDVTVDCGGFGLVDESELTRRILEVFQSPGYQAPRLPAVATELLALSSRPEVDLRQVEALLERDAMLAGEVLSICKSAAYDRGGAISSLRDALIRIGLVKLRGIVLQAAMSAKVFRSKAYKECMELLQEHSRATAHFARLVATHTPVDGERAFLAGLLHDVGIAGILIVLGDTKRGQEPPHLGALWPAIHGAHAIAGSCMVRHWSLPDEIAEAVGAHHGLIVNGTEQPLAAAVCLAERLATEQNKGFAPPASQAAQGGAVDGLALMDEIPVDQTHDSIVQRAVQTLGLDEAAYQKLRDAAGAWAGTQAA